MAVHPVFSVIVPVYNSDRSLKELYQRLVAVFRKELRRSFEIIFVDDDSNDRSWEVLTGLKQKSSGPVVIRLSRNFGQHSATLCGLNSCHGEYVVTMDDDLQHSPEEIPKLIRRMEETGADVVIGRPEKKQHSYLRNVGSLIIDRAYGTIFDKPAGLYIGSFRLMRSWVVKEIILNRAPNPMIGGLILQTTSRIVNEDLAHCKRAYGTSNYKLGTIRQLVVDLFINFSTIPLRLVSGCGALFFSLSVVAAVIIVFQKISGSITVPGWASIMILFLFFSGLNMIILGIVGEYLARIIKEVSNLKQYLIREKK